VRSDRFDYDLPVAAIAQSPAPVRDTARLLIDSGSRQPPRHGIVADLPGLLSPGDLLVVNTTRVLPARLRLRKATGGAAEVLLVSPLDADHTRWRAMVRPGRRLPPGTQLTPGGATAPVSALGRDRSPTPIDDPAAGEFAAFVVEVGDVLEDGQRVVRVAGVADPDAAISALGEVPLPPYIDAPPPDPERYQTVYADRATSVAAPTAGLHLTPAVLEACAGRDVGFAAVELDIGPGTFVPVTADELADHRMHAERYRVPAATVAAVEATRARGGTVVAVGTTVVRTLESWARTEEREGETDLFITPGFEFAVVDRLLTNFHQPRSTLLVLLEAFMGPRWREMYDLALAEGYRFLSFGDAMLVDRHG
jgi:S-adenosylmethionine:tRNA ribosyltransferase-isomerase